MNGSTNNIILYPKGKNNKFSAWSVSEIYADEQWIQTEIRNGEIVNFTLALNLSETGSTKDNQGNNYSGYKLSLYKNGTCITSSYLNADAWKDFKENCEKDNANTFFLGIIRKGDVNMGSYNAYGKMTLKNCRFYTRPLSDTEIKLNYDTRVAYDKDNS